MLGRMLTHRRHLEPLRKKLTSVSYAVLTLASVTLPSTPPCDSYLRERERVYWRKRTISYKLKLRRWDTEKTLLNRLSRRAPL